MKSGKGYIVQIFSLVVLMALQVFMLVLVRWALGGSEENAKAMYWATLAATVSVAITLILIIWAIMRWYRMVIQARLCSTATEYVDAWSEAGRRIAAPDEVEEEEDQEDQE